jgi:zinc carboxypeptidase
MRRMIAFVAALVMSAALATAGPAAAAPGQPAAGPSGPERASLVRIHVPDQTTLRKLVALGTDLTGGTRLRPDGLEVAAVLTPSQLKALSELGVREARAVPRKNRDTPRNYAAAADQIQIERAVWFQTAHGYFLSVEATSSLGADAELTVRWTGLNGTSGEMEIYPYVDAGVYLGHQPEAPVPADARPKFVTVTSQQGGSAFAKVSEWPDGQRVTKTGPRYQKDFVDHYMPPAELYQRITTLHERYPALTDLIKLPNKTHGYRRHAKALLGIPPAAAIVVTSKAYGSEGGNDLMIELVDPGAANRPLQVTVDGKLISVRLGTDGAGNPSSTAAQIVAALHATAGTLITASTYRGNPGAGVPAAAPATQLSDFLNAPASVSREPAQVLALRIGARRDGSRTGVLAYAQEHAREWVTPLVTIEAAERLLRNYATDAQTRKLLRETDIFLMPSVNPDGANYSFYDFTMQRKNMTNHCPPAQSDPFQRDSWGVDINRNYAVGSLFDGYFGASTNCVSGNYAGPAEHSEPESRNVIWMAERFRNIKFALNVHSYGGYFMWPPGAYKLPGRVTLPRPTPQQEGYFLESARTIVDAIAAERGTVTWPQQTGPVTDVLYSAAGNSADELWYDHGIFGWDFEVGNDIWDPVARRWTSVGFQPPFEPEGHAEALEYAAGLIALIGVAADYRG